MLARFGCASSAAACLPLFSSRFHSFQKTLLLVGHCLQVVGGLDRGVVIEEEEREEGRRRRNGMRGGREGEGEGKGKGKGKGREGQDDGNDEHYNIDMVEYGSAIVEAVSERCAEYGLLGNLFFFARKIEEVGENFIHRVGGGGGGGGGGGEGQSRSRNNDNEPDYGEYSDDSSSDGERAESGRGSGVGRQKRTVVGVILNFLEGHATSENERINVCRCLQLSGVMQALGGREEGKEEELMGILLRMDMLVINGID